MPDDKISWQRRARRRTRSAFCSGSCKRLADGVKQRGCRRTTGWFAFGAELDAPRPIWCQDSRTTPHDAFQRQDRRESSLLTLAMLDDRNTAPKLPRRSGQLRAAANELGSRSKVNQQNAAVRENCRKGKRCHSQIRRGSEKVKCGLDKVFPSEDRLAN